MCTLALVASLGLWSHVLCTWASRKEAGDLLLRHLSAIDRLEADIGDVWPQVRDLLARVLRIRANLSRVHSYGARHAVCRLGLTANGRYGPMVGIASLPVAARVKWTVHCDLLVGEELAEVGATGADTHDGLLLAWVGLVHELRVWLFGGVAADAKLTAHVPMAVVRVVALIRLPLRGALRDSEVLRALPTFGSGTTFCARRADRVRGRQSVAKVGHAADCGRCQTCGRLG